MSKIECKIKFENDVGMIKRMLLDHLELMSKQNNFESSCFATALEQVSIEFSKTAGYSRKEIEECNKAFLDYIFCEG